MAIIFMDSFDHYVTADLAKKWTSAGSCTIDSTGGRRSGGSLKCATSGQGATKTLPSNYASLIIGFAINYAAGTSTREILQLYDGATVQCSVSVNSSGAIIAWRGSTSTQLGISSNGVFPFGVYNFVEIKTTINGTTGSFTIKVNGTTVLTLTSQNNKTTANAYANGIGVFNDSNRWYDDFYVLDTSGSTNNDFIGDKKVVCKLPNSDGNYTQFTPSSGSTHYNLVNEATPDTTSYVTSATVGNRDSYAFQDLTIVGATIYGVQVNAALNKDDAGGKSACVFARSGTTNTDATGAALNTSQTYISSVFETDPNTSTAWTESTFNSAEFGVKVTA